MITEWAVKLGSWTAVLSISGVAGVQLAKTGLVEPRLTRKPPVVIEARIMDEDGRVDAGDSLTLNLKGIKNIYCQGVGIVIFMQTLDDENITHRWKAVEQDLANLSLAPFDVNWKLLVPDDVALPPGELWVTGHMTYAGCAEPAMPVVPFESQRIRKVAA